jgi:tRNA isopentenyl-2-thiomethyl-A-37 hydroxylase MiaE
LQTAVTSIATLATIKFLKHPTSKAWVDRAIAHLDTILLDHSHCERKAAGVALTLMFRYPAHEKLVRQLTAIAQAVTMRLEALSVIESDILATLHPEPRIHS